MVPIIQLMEMETVYKDELEQCHNTTSGRSARSQLLHSRGFCTLNTRRINY